MKTITIEEFRNLPTRPTSMEPFGRFAINEKVQKKQCENLKVGDTVFFMDTKDKGKGDDGIPQIDITLTQAEVVER